MGAVRLCLFTDRETEGRGCGASVFLSRRDHSAPPGAGREACRGPTCLVFFLFGVFDTQARGPHQLSTLRILREILGGAPALGFRAARGQPFWGEFSVSRKCKAAGSWTGGRSDVTLELEGRGGVLEARGGVGGRGLAGQRSF